MNVKFECSRKDCGSVVYAQPGAPINKLPCALNLAMGKESPDHCGLKQVEEWNGDDPMRGFDAADDKPIRDHKDARLRSEMVNVEGEVKAEAVNQSGEIKAELTTETAANAAKRTAQENINQEGFQEPKNKAQMEADEAQAKKQADKDKKDSEDRQKANEDRQAKSSGDKVTTTKSPPPTPKRSR